MGFLGHLLYPWGFLLQGLAIVHFIRRRPDTYWIFIILFLGAPGAIIYLAVEALPDIGLVGQSFKVFPRRKRIHELEPRFTTILGRKLRRTRRSLHGRRQIRRCRAAFDKAIGAAPIRPIPFTGAEFARSSWETPRPRCPTWNEWSAKSPLRFQRAAGLLAHAYARTGQKEKAEALFRQ